MLVSEVYEDIKDATGLINQQTVFSRLTDAVSVLSNKGNWDSMLTYLDIPTTNDYFITLPESVEMPLRININGNPSFSRDRLWEFTLNGPGSNDQRLGFQWEDRGSTPPDPGIMQPEHSDEELQSLNQSGTDTAIPTPSVFPHGAYSLHFPISVTMSSRDLGDAIIIYTLDGTPPTWDNGVHGSRVVRLTLNGETTLNCIADRPSNPFHPSAIVTNFYTSSPAPLPPPPPAAVGTRIIRLSQKAVTVRMLCRLKTNKIISLDQWIPLNSKPAIVLMCKALQSYRRGTQPEMQLGKALEEQALVFLSDEQKARNVAFDMSKAMDDSPVTGYNLNSNSGIIVADIYDDAASICHGAGKQFVFDRITEAVEILSNKGKWDSQLAYVDINLLAPGSLSSTALTDIVTLPRDVFSPIRININSKPSMARDKLFEFSINGPGDDWSEVTTFTWMDGESSPVILQPNNQRLRVDGNSAVDGGKKVTIKGLDHNGKEVEADLTIPVNLSGPGTIPPVTFVKVTEVVKEITQFPVTLSEITGRVLSVYYPDETNPKYRQIKLSTGATEIKVLYRKENKKISAVTDFIPLGSRSSILLMLRSLQLMRSDALTPDVISSAKALEDQALAKLTEREGAVNSFKAQADMDKQPCIGINYTGGTVIIAGDLYDDACDIFGYIGRQRLMDKMSESIELLSNKSQWDGLDGYIDINTDKQGYFSLPRGIEVPVQMSINGTPATMRNRWFEFHPNGTKMVGTSYKHWDDLGEFPTLKEPPYSQQLYAECDVSSDAGKQIRVYGYDLTGTWVQGPDGKGGIADGYSIPMAKVIIPPPNPTPGNQQPFFKIITRIHKDATTGFVKLVSYGPPDPTSSTPTPFLTILGYFFPDETEPMYRRIAIPINATWVRMRYRKSSMKISSLFDAIPLRSKSAVVAMMRSLKFLEGGDIQNSELFSQKAVEILSAEQQSRNPGQVFDLEADCNISWADPLQGRW